MAYIDEIDQLNGFLNMVILESIYIKLLDGIWKEVFLILDLPSLGTGVKI